MKGTSIVRFIGPAAVFAVLAGAISCGAQPATPARADAITIGMESTAVNSLIYIAEDQKFFAANRLNVTINDSYPSGAAAAEGMLKGEVNIATAAELAIVRNAFTRQDLVTLASIDRFMHMKLVARADRGIKDIPDLKGKKIGVPLKSAADFMLGRFLDLNGIKTDQITIVDVQAPQAVAAMTNGDVDALVAWQPNVLAVKDRLGENAVIWSVQSGQPMYCAVVAQGTWAKGNPDAGKRFLTSLKRAEDYLLSDPGAARRIVQTRLNYDDRYMDTIWPDHELSVRLDQSLITAMEDQARWMISNSLTTETRVPNFLDYTYEDALVAVKPDGVKVIR